MKKTVQLLIIFITGITISLLPVPKGLSIDAWLFFSIFICVIIGLIIEPFPSAYIGLLGIVVACLLKIGPVPVEGGISSGKVLSWGLSGFSDSTVWLIFVAFMFASGFEKTGLGKRIAFFLVNKLGKKTLGLGYAIAFADLLLAPVMPSNTARSGATIFPIIRNIPILFGSSTTDHPRKIGSYITWVAISSTCVTSSMFLTALAPNLLSISLIKELGWTTPSWSEWFFYFLPVGIILILLIPFITYILYPPTLKGSEQASEWAKKELKKMGKISGKEIVMTLLFITALLLWIFGETLGIHSTVAAITVFCLMVLTKILSWDDILSNKSAWNVLVWFGTLISLAGGLNNVGVLDWLAGNITEALVSYSPLAILICLVIAFFLIHYFFASSTAHVTALFLLFLLSGADIPGMNIPLLTYLLLYSVGLMGIITPYGTGPSPIWYSFGYIPSKTFWLLGAIYGLFFLIILLLIGIPWINYWLQN